MNWYLDVFANDETDGGLIALATIERLQREESLSGPCEDDCEVTAPFIGICPDDTDHEEPSPLDFGGFRRYGEGTKPASEIFKR